MTFKTWKFRNTQFLAVPTHDNHGVEICDEHGTYYGSFISVEYFRASEKSMLKNWIIMGQTASLQMAKNGLTTADKLRMLA